MLATAFASLLMLAPPIAAQTATPPERVATLLVFGEDACPKGDDDEIIVCARLPENERYRVPKRFREKKADRGGQSWANTARELEWVGRSGLPNSCSVNGSNGQTGCFQQFMRMAREEREQAKREAAGVP
ncbi:hypothetical protein ABC347_15370 [Sphingomonas sp. 1P06PA]|uniref:hypothetical protein n=1 Tax=Sphingomonas sp. 1P06PA TaxID=554121 RepID=UPI0039A75F96